MDLDSMKYAELRSLAKELGLKANMKGDKLLKAIKQLYEQKKKEEEQGNEKDAAVEQKDENEAQVSTQENKDATCKEDVSSTSVFVNTRRGKGNGTKRKISEIATVTECNELPPTAEEVDAEVTASSPSGGTRGAKKRRVSSASDSEKVDTELPAEPPAANSEQQPAVKGNASKIPKAGKIPRYEGVQKKKALLKPSTPNFKKLHEAHFNKMESIDSYVHRKNKQIESYKNPVKELKMPSDKVKQQKVDVKTQVKANVSRTSMFSPVTVNKRPAPQTKPAEKKDALFRPSVISTRRINVRFSEATQDNEHKRSLVKTPARKSLCVTSSTPLKQTEDGGKPNTMKTLTFSASKTPGPFVFIGNTSTNTTPGTQKKTNFDLKASLSRPLSYKPHTGKLKPFGEAKENAAGNKSLVSNSHQKNYKQHQVQTRAERRTKHTEDRKQKKANMLGARRGLVMM
ncbi:nucleolar and spindle-associated protein 1 [Scomber japonicus]|uniref:nucleolar and spindle-associated protein 1 n=1 Tax=Scomber japonicus TaxID=13676 RepID=UPI0023054AA7|nr:nucleolar and spindle-associated protein 1 [Scomber japonicus]